MGVKREWLPSPWRRRTTSDAEARPTSPLPCSPCGDREARWCTTGRAAGACRGRARKPRRWRPRSKAALTAAAVTLSDPGGPRVFPGRQTTDPSTPTDHHHSHAEDGSTHAALESADPPTTHESNRLAHMLTGPTPRPHHRLSRPRSARSASTMCTRATACAWSAVTASRSPSAAPRPSR